MNFSGGGGGCQEIYGPRMPKDFGTPLPEIEHSTFSKQGRSLAGKPTCLSSPQSAAAFWVFRKPASYFSCQDRKPQLSFRQRKLTQQRQPWASQNLRKRKPDVRSSPLLRWRTQTRKDCPFAAPLLPNLPAKTDFKTPQGQKCHLQSHNLAHGCLSPT